MGGETGFFFFVLVLVWPAFYWPSLLTVISVHKNNFLCSVCHCVKLHTLISTSSKSTIYYSLSKRNILILLTSLANVCIHSNSLLDPPKLYKSIILFSGNIQSPVNWQNGIKAGAQRKSPQRSVFIWCRYYLKVHLHIPFVASSLLLSSECISHILWKLNWGKRGKPHEGLNTSEAWPVFQMNIVSVSVEEQIGGDGWRGIYFVCEACLFYWQCSQWLADPVYEWRYFYSIGDYNVQQSLHIDLNCTQWLHTSCHLLPCYYPHVHYPLL